ncbi:uncharacterized protein vlc isoform X2 [Eurosta solidaginis]|uniref:uncharacterized protein vlc isoform X2 n=1 Tax=Eurosta solidaginis TaxID=178769 RepID=UPI00353079A3
MRIPNREFKDTSGSLNFPTPISIKDITREFTTNIRERCSGQDFHEINTNFPGIEMAIKQPLGNANPASALVNASKIKNLTDASPDKKPSYLNLACCVNGYSNLTTYDSKIRKDINKSREVSPIRPSSNSIQYCKKNNSLAPPILLQMDDGQCYSVGFKNRLENNESHRTDSLWQEDRRNTSFIQERVERLYGPSALAQAFYSPKKVRSSTFAYTPNQEYENAGSSELIRKFQQLTPSKDYTEFRKKIYVSTSNSPRQVLSSTDVSNVNNNTVDLPVLRHLSQEFRAQLPIISPKKSQSRNSRNNYSSPEYEATATAKKYEVLTVDHEEIPLSTCEIRIEHSTNGFKREDKILAQSNIIDSTVSGVEEDGTYFLNLLKSEQNRLLAMADVAEQYSKELSDNPEVSEDTLGFLRSAYGKARLLVSQKMKQFEGLCQKNLNSSPDDKFPTTNDDLQGFWDMVYLQVDHINSIFDEIDELKSNNWKKSVEDMKDSNKPTKVPQKTTKTVNKKVKHNTSNASELKSNSAKSAATLKRDSQRKMLQEMKRKNKIALSGKTTTSTMHSLETNVDAVEIFVKTNK